MGNCENALSAFTHSGHNEELGQREN